MTSSIRTNGRTFDYVADMGSKYECMLYDDPDCLDSYHLVRGSGRITGIYVNGVQTSAIPEPSSWALLIAGFGLVGFSLRKKRMKMA